MAQWVPQEEGVKQILQVLSAMSSSDSAVHVQIQEQVTRFRQIPDFNRYLLWIVNNLKGEENEFVRASAGLLIKNNLLYHYDKINQEEQNYLKNEVVKTLGDPSHQIRRTCGILITVLLYVSSVRGWPGIIVYLSNCLDSPDTNTIEGAFMALDKICEDHGPELDTDGAGKPVNFLLPKFLHFFKSPKPEHRALALSCITKLMFTQPPPLISNMDRFLEGFFFLAQDPELKIRKRVVNACLTLIEHCANHIDIKNQFPKLIEYMLFCIRDNNMELAFDASDFWHVITNNYQICEVVLKPYLPQVFSILLTRMMYTKDDLADIGGYEDGAEDSHVPDNPQDIKPAFTSAQVRGSGKADDDDYDDYDTVGHWNIRKSSAEGLDFVAQVFPGKITVEILLPIVEKGLQSPDWLTRESSILALGCVAKGSYEEMKPFLAGLVPYLFSLLNDKYPLIRSITCWTISRYSAWVYKQPEKDKYFNRLITELLVHMRDKNKRVQKAASSALAAAIDAARENIIPYTAAILQSIQAAFGYFQRANINALYDCVSTLAWAIGDKLNNPAYLSNLLPPLFSLWDKYKDDDTDLFPLFECFSQVAVALGSGFAPYAKQIFGRCEKIMEETMICVLRAKADPQKFSPPNREFLVCSVDLISALFRALRTSMEPLLSSPTCKLIPILVEVCKDPGVDFSQSAFALVGDIANYCHEHLRPVVLSLMPCLISGMNPYHKYTCNNAIWAAGELFYKLKSQQLTEQFAEPVLTRVSQIFMDKNADFQSDTCAVAMGRVSKCAPSIIAANLQSYIRPWCFGLRNIQDDYEKECGLVGMCEVIKLNPFAVVGELPAFCEVIASLHYISDPTNTQLFGNMLHTFKGQVPPQQWEAVIRGLSRSTQDFLKKKYSL